MGDNGRGVPACAAVEDIAVDWDMYDGSRDNDGRCEAGCRAMSNDVLAGVEVPDVVMEGCRLRAWVPVAAAVRSAEACD